MRSEVEKSVSDLAAAGEKPLEDLTNQLATIKRDLQKLSSQLVELVSREKNSMSESARRMASDLSSTLDSYGVNTGAVASEVKARTSDLQRAIASEVRANPMRALMITVGVGLVLGAISRRR